MPRFVDALNMEQHEIKNARLHSLAGAPSNPVEGQLYYDDTANTPYYYDGVSWLPMTGANYRYAYNPATVYSKNDFVTYNGSTYIVTVPGAAGLVPTDTAHWDLLSAGGVSTYSNATPMPTNVGGLGAGQTFSSMSITEVLNRLLYPYQTPGFSSFTMTGLVSTVEVGTTLSGSKTFTWATSNASNVTPGSVSILQGATVLASGLNASGSTTVPITTVTNSTPGSVTFTIKGTNTNGVQFSTAFSVSWQYKRFNGTSTSDTLDSNAIQALATNALSSSGAGTYTFAAGGYKYIAVPVSFSAFVTIKDASNGLPMDMADSASNAAYSNTANGWSFALVNVTNGLGVTSQYRVYRSRNILGGAYSIVTS